MKPEPNKPVMKITTDKSKKPGWFLEQGDGEVFLRYRDTSQETNAWYVAQLHPTGTLRTISSISRDGTGLRLRRDGSIKVEPFA